MLNNMMSDINNISWSIGTYLRKWKLENENGDKGNEIENLEDQIADLREEIKFEDIIRDILRHKKLASMSRLGMDVFSLVYNALRNG